MTDLNRDNKVDFNDAASGMIMFDKVFNEAGKDKITKLMKEYNIPFKALSAKLNISNHTLTRKVNGSTDWTYSEIMLLTELFHIEDPQSFFF